MLSGKTGIIQPSSGWRKALGCDDQIIAITLVLHPAPHYRFCFAQGTQVAAQRIGVSRIKKSQPVVDRFIKDSARAFLIDLKPKCHRTKTQRWHFQPMPPHSSLFHLRLLLQ